jgi:RNase P/RNase MRP subunit p29
MYRTVSHEQEPETGPVPTVTIPDGVIGAGRGNSDTVVLRGWCMQSMRGRIEGPLTINRDLDVHGTIAGEAIVRTNNTLHLRGAITGNLTIEKGASAIIYGTVGGRIHKIGGTVVIVHPQSSGREDPSNDVSSSIDS